MSGRRLPALNLDSLFFRRFGEITPVPKLRQINRKTVSAMRKATPRMMEIVFKMCANAASMNVGGGGGQSSSNMPPEVGSSVAEEGRRMLVVVLVNIMVAGVWWWCGTRQTLG